MPATAQQNIPLSTPFENIAVALSGGGFRAAAYGLGVLSYLDHLKLPGTVNPTFLSKMKFISSASGGTIISILYSMYLRQGKSFKDCYVSLLDKMKGEELLNAVLEKLNNDNEWDKTGTGKRRNLINAFAKVYDEKLFEGETFDIFWQDQNDLSVCFNTTDFYRGLSFRFQTDGNNKTYEYTGNRYVHFDRKKEAYKKIKLADILAASSCFPAGFEPIVFPNDFVYSKSLKGNSLSPGELENAIILEGYDSSVTDLNKPVAFMDGGITDNQGLQSAMYADSRARNQGNPFDLIIVGDVTSHFMDAYKPPVQQQAEGWRKWTINGILNKLSGIGKKIKGLLTGSIIVFLASLLLVVLSFFAFDIPFLRYTGFTLAGISLTTTILLAVINRFGLKQPFLNKLLHPSVPGIIAITEDLNIDKSFSEDIIKKLMDYLGDAKLNVIEQMLKARATSVLTMTMDVNLKHIRRLIYEIFYENEIWTDRRLYNVIFELSDFNKSNREFRIKTKLKWATNEDKELLNSATTDMRKIAEDARTMGTTLWFGQPDVKNEKLKKIVSCGQFTTCMNLIEYILCLERKIGRNDLTLAPAELDKIAYVKKQLLEDLDKFKTDPYFLYESYKN